MKHLFLILPICLFFSLSGNAFSERLTLPVPSNDSIGDLSIVNIEITKRRKKAVCLSYEVINKGSAPINVLGSTNKNIDNLSVRAYLSGDQKLNRTDLLIDGMFLPNNLPNDGVLKPGESFTLEMKVDLHLKTNYISVLILKVDDVSIFREADETNNYTAIIL